MGDWSWIVSCGKPTVVFWWVGIFFIPWICEDKENLGALYNMVHLEAPGWYLVIFDEGKGQIGICYNIWNIDFPSH